MPKYTDSEIVEFAHKKMQELIDNAILGIDFLIDPENNQTTESILECFPPDSPLIEDEYLKKISKVRGISMKALREQLKILRETGVMLNPGKKEKEKKRKTKGELFSYYKIRDMILSTYHIKTLYQNGEVCIYKNGVYKRNQDRNLGKIISDMMEELEITFSKNKKNDLIDLIKTETLEIIEKFDVDPYILNLKNGLLNILTNELKKHTPKYLSLRQIPVNYNKNAECPAIDKFLLEIFYPNDIDFIYQWSGLCLTPIMFYQKALLLYGEGWNGKTTFFNFLIELIGRDNISTVKLQNLDQPFMKARMENKLLNLVSDIDAGDTGIQTFKVYVGDESIFTINRKFRAPYDTKPISKLAYSCNNVFPKVPNYTDKGYWRKWVLINCPYNFENRDTKNFIKNLTTQKELSGFLNKAIRGFQQLHGNDGFEAKYNNWQRVKKIWFLKQTVFLDFLDKFGEMGKYVDGNTSKDNEYWEVKSVVHDLFNQWREEDLNQPAINMAELTKIVNRTPKLGTTSRLVDKKRYQIYTGFRLRR